jgi:DNA-binding transcriptional MerR regulator
VAGERFFQVDTELKDLCGQLRDMGTPLAVVAQIIAAGKSQPSPAEDARPAAGVSRPADNRVRLEGQLAEQDRKYKALTDKIAALDQDIGRTFDSEQRLALNQRRDAHETERSAVSKKMSDLETQLDSLKDR